MTGAARVRRPELRERRQVAHRESRAARAGGGPSARVTAEVDHLRSVIKKLPADQAAGVADRVVRALREITATHPTRRRTRRTR